MAYDASVNGAPAKPMSGTRPASSRLHLPDRVEHVAERLARLEPADGREVGFGAQRLLDRGPFAGDEIERDAHLLERQQQIGKQNRRVDLDAADRLQRDGGREIGRAADVEQRIALAQLAILAHVAAGLAHEPDRRRVNRLASAGLKEPARPTRSVRHLQQVAGEADQIFEPQRLESQFGAELPQLRRRRHRRGSSRR